MQILALAVLVVVYLTACLAVILVVGVPAALLLGSVATAVGAVGALGLITSAYVGRADDQELPADQGVAPHVLPDQPAAVEPAWRHYLSTQWFLDVRAAYDRIDDANSRMWSTVRDVADDAMGEFAVVLWPVAWVPYAVAAGATLGAAVAGGVTAAVVALPAGLAWLLRAGCVRILRRSERSRQRRHRSSATCIAEGCDDVSRWPVVECGCGRRHHRLEPGPFGAARRRCTCGRLLPTTVTTAARTLQLRCPRCDRPLPAGTMTDADVRIAVLGAPGSGRSLLTGAGLDDLRAAVLARGGRIEEIGPADGAPPVDRACHSIRLGRGRRWVSVHVYDPIGEALDIPARRRRLHYLRHTQGYLLVIDAAALPGVVGRVPGAATAVDPEHTYRAIVAYLRDDRVDLDGRALAVVLRRVDTLATVGVGAPPEGAGSTELRTWLASLGAGNLTVAAERDFGSVRYFRSSAAEGRCAAAALAWLAGVAGVDVPRPHRRDR